MSLPERFEKKHIRWLKDVLDNPRPVNELELHADFFNIYDALEGAVELLKGCKSMSKFNNPDTTYAEEKIKDFLGYLETGKSSGIICSECGNEISWSIYKNEICRNCWGKLIEKQIIENFEDID